MKKYQFNNILIFTVLMMWIQHTFAEEFCVKTSTELQAALTAAANNGEADHIKLNKGTYSIINGNSFVFLTTNLEFYNLRLSGGWSDFFGGQCNFRTLNTSAYDTVIDGNNQNRGLRLDPTGAGGIEISELTFQNGLKTGFEGGGISIQPRVGYTGFIIIESNVFQLNEATYGAAIHVRQGRVITVRNNLILVNHATDGGSVDLNSNDLRGIYVTNNTIIANSTDGTGTLASAVINRTTGSSQVFVANNIIWNNEIRDLAIIAPTFLYNNNIGSYVGDPIAFAENISEEPEFQPGLLNFLPQLSGNLHNKGRHPPNSPPFPIPFEDNWAVGLNDVLGADRVVNGRIDMGSFETPPETPIFKDGFEGI